MNEHYIAGVDLGSSKISITVGRVNNGKETELVFFREYPSDGIRHGVVFNPTRAAEVVKQAISEAEAETDIKLERVVVGKPRYPIIQETAPASKERENPESCIEEEEIDELKNTALENYPLDDVEKQDIYGAVVQSFSTEDLMLCPKEDIVGVPSKTLEGNFKVFVGDKKAVSNISTMMQKIGISAARKYFLPDYTAHAILTDNEMSNGVALVEIGGGVTSITIYRNNILRYYASIPFGGKSITWDIKNEFCITEKLAENIKLGFGACLPDKLFTMSEKILQINDDENSNITKIPVKELSEVITARIQEIIKAVLFLIDESGYADRLRSGVVLTGGVAETVNLVKLFQETSGYNTRIGYPRVRGIITEGYSGFLSCASAAMVGMLLKAAKDSKLNCTEAINKSNERNNEEDIIQDMTGTVFEDSSYIDDNQPSKKTRKPRKEGNKIQWQKKTAYIGAKFFGLFGDIYADNK